MASRDDVVKYIRFQLSELRARNEHHPFEHLCRELARKRVAANVLPATGPVAAGGDQGRDFETFRTYLEQVDSTTHAFRAKANQAELAFICTLQVSDLPSKVRSDIKSMIASGYKPETVYSFTEANVPVATRHALQREIQEGYGIRLEMLDGEAISDQLAETDTFWIAQSFLGIPSEIYSPPPTAPEEWYVEARERWSSRESVNLTPGELTDLKEAIREASTNPDLLVDVPFWIGHLRRFIQDAVPESMQRRAFYEIVVASLKGLESFAAVESEFDWYFASASNTGGASQLADSQVLLNYIAGGRRRIPGITSVTADQLADWRALIGSRCKDLLKDERLTVGERCSLMETVALLDLGLPDDNGDISDSHVNAAFGWWKLLIDEIPEVPLFPVDRMAEYMAIIAPALFGHPDYRAITSRLDALVAERSGNAAAAGFCRDRAIALQRTNHLVAALAEFHQAKADWFTGDTIRGAILSMALIARCYQLLGLQYAAEQYYLATAWVALNVNDGEHSDLAGPMLIEAAQVAFYRGDWLTFIDRIGVASRGHAALAADADSLLEDKNIQGLLVLAAISYTAATKLLPPETVRWIEESLEDVEALELVQDLCTDEQSPWQKATGDEILRLSCEQTGCSPFGDVGQQQIVRFAALGLIWSVTFDNDYGTSLAAGRFLSVLQVVLADLAARDLLLIPTSVDIEIKAAKRPPAHSSQVRPSNDGRLWTISLTLYDGKARTPRHEDALPEALAAVAAILADASLLPAKDFYDQIEDLFKEGLLHKVSPGNLYDRLLEAFYGDDQYVEAERNGSAPFDGRCPGNPKPQKELAWLRGPGPGYSSARSAEFLRNRYRNMTERLGALPSTLGKRADFQTVLERLRSRGWLDWHILAAIFNAAGNYHLSKQPPTITSEETGRAAWKSLPESFDAIDIPAEVFSEEELEHHRVGNLLASLQTWGLELGQQTPDFPAIERFMAERYGYWCDDVEHPDPFEHG